MLICATKVITVDTVSDLASIHNDCGTDIYTAIVLGYHEKHDGGVEFLFMTLLWPNDNDGGLVLMDGNAVL